MGACQGPGGEGGNYGFAFTLAGVLTRFVFFFSFPFLLSFSFPSFLFFISSFLSSLSLSLSSFFVTKYLQLRNISVGNHAYENKGAERSGMAICQHFYKQGNILPGNDTFDIDPKIETGNVLL